MIIVNNLNNVIKIFQMSKLYLLSINKCSTIYGTPSQDMVSTEVDIDVLFQSFDQYCFPTNDSASLALPFPMIGGVGAITNYKMLIMYSPKQCPLLPAVCTAYNRPTRKMSHRLNTRPCLLLCGPPVE